MALDGTIVEGDVSAVAATLAQEGWTLQPVKIAPADVRVDDVVSSPMAAERDQGVATPRAAAVDA